MGLTRQYYLLVVSDREALGWILREQRMAFPATRQRMADELRSGDELVVYVTRGCFRNPTRDRGRVIAVAQVTSSVVPLDPWIEFGGRTFTRGCDLEIADLAPLEHAPELGHLVDRLGTFPPAPAWAVHIRRTLVPLDQHDFSVLARALSSVAVPRREALPEYLERAKPVRSRKP